MFLVGGAALGDRIGDGGLALAVALGVVFAIVGFYQIVRARRGGSPAD